MKKLSYIMIAIVSLLFVSCISSKGTTTITYGNTTDTINLLDAKYYASNTRIHNEAIPISDGTKNIFISTYNTCR